jgi:hypothetical protein
MQRNMHMHIAERRHVLSRNARQHAERRVQVNEAQMAATRPVGGSTRYAFKPSASALATPLLDAASSISLSRGPGPSTAHHHGAAPPLLAGSGAGPDTPFQPLGNVPRGTAGGAHTDASQKYTPGKFGAFPSPSSGAARPNAFTPQPRGS